MASKRSWRQFNLEVLEPRLLLSAAPVGVELAPMTSDLASADTFCEAVAQEIETGQVAEGGPAGVDLFDCLSSVSLESPASPVSSDAEEFRSSLDSEEQDEGLDPRALPGRTLTALASVSGAPPPVDLAGPLQLVPPFGAGVYCLPGSSELGSSSAGYVSDLLSQTGDSRVFRISLDGGQTLSVRVGSLESGVSVRLDIRGPDNGLLGTASSTGPGPCDVEVDVADAGSYSFVVTSIEGQTDFTLSLLLEGQFEAESATATTNDTLSTAEWLGPVNTRGPPAVVGNVYPTSPDWYSVDLEVGDHLTLTSAVLRFAAERHVDLEVADASGTVLARGISGGSLGLDDYVCSFQAPASGRYYI